MIDADGIEALYERMLRSDVKYRIVIDLASMGRELQRTRENAATEVVISARPLS